MCINEDSCIVAFSCDIYQEVWKLFYRSFDRYWENHPQIYICNEFIDCKSDKFKNLTYRDNNVNHWSINIYNCIKDLPYEYIIFMDCDHIPVGIDGEKIIDTIQYMRVNQDVGRIRFLYLNDSDSQSYDINISDVHYFDLDTNIGSLCQSSIWKKDCLIQWLKQSDIGMNPWQWESENNNIHLLNSFKYYSPTEDYSGKLINYLYSGCVSDGYWKVEYFCCVVDLHDGLYDGIDFIKNGFIINDINDNDQLLEFIDKFSIIYPECNYQNYITTFYKGIHDAARNEKGLTNYEIIENISKIKD